MNLLIATAILAHALLHLTPRPSALDLVLLFGVLMTGTACLLAVRLLFILPVFWLTQVDALRELSWTLHSIGERPSHIYPKAFRIAFTFIFPILTATALPAEALLRGWQLETVATIVGVTFVLWIILLRVWTAGTRIYSSASS
jgi:ABC-type uncharacterized transport system permease subunit